MILKEILPIFNFRGPTIDRINRDSEGDRILNIIPKGKGVISQKIAHCF